MNKLLTILLICLLIFSCTASLRSQSQIKNINSINSNAPKYIQESLTQAMLFNYTNKFFNFTSANGYNMERDTNGKMIDNSKNILDYISAVNFISSYIGNYLSNPYPSYLQDFLSLIEKFNSNGGYYSTLNSNWSVNPNSYFESSTLGSLISMYANLYNATQNKPYLQQALNIYNYLEKNFYDPVHSGYYSQINPSSLKYNPDSNRSLRTYGIIINAYYDLSMDTHNQTIYNQGSQLLNYVITNDYNSAGYLYPILFESTNLPDNNITQVRLTYQIGILDALKEYKIFPSILSNIENFMNNKLLINVKLPLRNTDGSYSNTAYVFSAFYADSYSNYVKENNTFSFIDQLEMYNYYFSYGTINEPAEVGTFLQASQYISDSFFNVKNSVFGLSMNSTLSTPYINFEWLLTSEIAFHFGYRFGFLYLSSNTKPSNADNIITNPLTYLVPIMVIVLIVAGVRLYKLREKKKLKSLLSESSSKSPNQFMDRNK